MANGPFSPTKSLLVKLGSIIIHLQEYQSPRGHPYDLETANSLLNDDEVKRWLGLMNGMGLLPVKR